VTWQVSNLSTAQSCVRDLLRSCQEVCKGAQAAALFSAVAVVRLRESHTIDDVTLRGGLGR
jgi:hypothetical protein